MDRRRLLVGVTLLCAVAVGSSASSQAASTLYVDKDSRGGACRDDRAAADVTQATPWCTLTRAVAAAPSGSTVVVRGGSYPKFELSGARQRTSMVTFTERVLVENRSTG